MAKLRKFAPGQFQIINKRDGNTPYLNPNQTIRNLMLTSKKKNINIKCEYEHKVAAAGSDCCSS